MSEGFKSFGEIGGILKGEKIQKNPDSIDATLVGPPLPPRKIRRERGMIGSKEQVVPEAMPATAFSAPYLGDVFICSDDESRVEVLDIRGDMLRIAEDGPAGTGNQESKISWLSFDDFRAYAQERGMASLDPMRDREPEFYAAYEAEMEKLESVFTREVLAVDGAMNRWSEEIAEGSDGIFIKEILLRRRLEEIVNEWNATNDNFVHGGRRRFQILQEIRAFPFVIANDAGWGENFEERFASWKAETLESEGLKEKFNDSEPDGVLIERGYFRDVLYKKSQRILDKCREVKEKKRRFSKRAGTPGAFRESIEELVSGVVGYDSEDPKKETTVVDIKRILDKLDELEALAFSHKEVTEKNSGSQSSAGAGIDKKRRKRKIEDGELVQKKKRSRRARAPEVVLADDAVVSIQHETAVPSEVRREMKPSEALASYRQLLENLQGEVNGHILNADAEYLEKLYSVKKGVGRIFISVQGEALELFDSLGSASQRAARDLWREMNLETESLYLGRKFDLALESMREFWREKINEAESLSDLQLLGKVVRVRMPGKNNDDKPQFKKCRVFIPVGNPLDKNSDFKPLREILSEMVKNRRELSELAGKDGFQRLFSEQLNPQIIDINESLSSVWEERFLELGGDAIEGEGARVSSTELVDPKALEREALRLAESYFVDEAIPTMEETLREFGVDLIVLLGIYEEDADGLSDEDKRDQEERKKGYDELLDSILTDSVREMLRIISTCVQNVPDDVRKQFESKIRESAKSMLIEKMMERASRMIESK